MRCPCYVPRDAVASPHSNALSIQGLIQLWASFVIMKTAVNSLNSHVFTNLLRRRAWCSDGVCESDTYINVS